MVVWLVTYKKLQCCWSPAITGSSDPSRRGCCRAAVPVALSWCGELQYLLLGAVTRRRQCRWHSVPATTLQRPPLPLGPLSTALLQINLCLLAPSPALSNLPCHLIKSVEGIKTPAEELYAPCQSLSSCGPQRVGPAFGIVNMDQDMLFPTRTKGVHVVSLEGSISNSFQGLKD